MIALAPCGRGIISMCSALKFGRGVSGHFWPLFCNLSLAKLLNAIFPVSPKRGESKRFSYLFVL